MNKEDLKKMTTRELENIIDDTEEELTRRKNQIHRPKEDNFFFQYGKGSE